MTLRIKQGTDQIIKIPSVTDSSGVLVTNWSGWSARAQARSRVESTPVLHEWSTTDNSITFVGSDVMLHIPHATSTAWPWDQAVVDVELTDPAGMVTRIAEDRLNISPEVTR